jgi:hypothetical protein
MTRRTLRGHSGDKVAHRKNVIEAGVKQLAKINLSKFGAWHSRALESVMAVHVPWDGGGHLTAGLAQKMLNVAVKYLFCFGWPGYDCIEGVHITLDQYILTGLLSSSDVSVSGRGVSEVLQPF